MKDGIALFTCGRSQDGKRGKTSSILPMLMLMAAGACAARSGMGNAVVSQVGEVPCFGVESTGATRRGNPELQAISVTDQKGNPVWRSYPLPQHQVSRSPWASASSTEPSCPKRVSTSSLGNWKLARCTR